MNFANYVDIAAREVPEKLATSDPTREMRYGDLATGTDAVANGLFGLGVDPGDRVALFMRLDADGHLVVEYRLDDVVVTGGESVYPSQVEGVIADLDGVVDVAVMGTDDRLGERVTAVVRADGSIAEADVAATCRERLADYKVPCAVHFVEELPRTATRKIDNGALGERFGA